MAKINSFKDLNFQSGNNGKQATVFFPNGYGASIITGGMAYCNNECPYELAVLKGNTESYQLTYDTEITDDVLGYLTENEVTKLLEKISSLVT